MTASSLTSNVETATVGVLGVGVVGNAVRSYFESKGRNVPCYDKFKGTGSVDEINQADIVFICVPTPYVEGHGLDSGAVEEAVSLLEGERIVVLKSTSLPGTTFSLAALSAAHFLLQSRVPPGKSSSRGLPGA